MIRRCVERDFELILDIVNDGAQAYKGVIPADRWHEPYMSATELRREVEDGVVFWTDEDAEKLRGIIGLQQVRDVALIRHAYVRSSCQRRGVGGCLLSHLLKLVTGPVLVGTWTDAEWAIRFYRSHGFELVEPVEKERLLRKYWTIPDRQIETSVVLVWPNDAQA